MFGNLFGDLEERQKKMKATLAEIIVEHEVGDGAIRLKANANRELTDIVIDTQKISFEDPEQLQDLLIVGINEILSKAAEEEKQAAEELMRDMLPPGLGGLGNLFGQ